MSADQKLLKSAPSNEPRTKVVLGAEPVQEHCGANDLQVGLGLDAEE